MDSFTSDWVLDCEFWIKDKEPHPAFDDLKAEIAVCQEQIANDGSHSALKQMIGGLILRGLEIKYVLMAMGSGSILDPCRFVCDLTPETRHFFSACRVWTRQVDACIAKWSKHKWDYTSRRTKQLRFMVDVRLGIGGVFLVRDIEALLDELRSVLPELTIMTADIREQIRTQLTGDELDHAEQLLSVQGQHEEAILRAAGVIAGVVLERHLSDLVDKTNPTVPAGVQYTRNPKADGMQRYMDWLIGQRVIQPTERKPIEHLIFIRNCCGHPPSVNLRVPTREEVTRLIADTRQYVATLKSP